MILIGVVRLNLTMHDKLSVERFHHSFNDCHRAKRNEWKKEEKKNVENGNIERRNDTNTESQKTWK